MGIAVCIIIDMSYPGIAVEDGVSTP
jgi:hypothetical protein